MGAVAFLIVFLALIYDSSSVWLANSSVFKPKNILPLPVGMAPSVAESVARGAETAFEYCHNIFKWEKWNCPRSAFFRVPNQQPNRETAFSKAILAAGLVHTITRDCSKGEIAECGCDTELGAPSVVTNSKLNRSSLTQELEANSNDWSWGGCSDDPKYALEVTKKLLRGLEKDNNPADYVGRHNSKVGREIISDTMVKKCRCHGTSGSCSIRTCWIQVAPFGEVTKRLKDKYKKAERLTYEAVEQSVSLGNSAREIVEEKAIPVKKNSLVYLVLSPDYCVANSTEDLPGTKGRKCSRNTSEKATPAEKKSCRSLCRDCGHKVKKVKKKEMKKCNCKFVWCCEIECDTCMEEVEEHFCH